jgi:hypothetical protein
MNSTVSAPSRKTARKARLATAIPVCRDSASSALALRNCCQARGSCPSLDHKPLEELRTLFRDFANKAQTVVLNLDNAETAALLSDVKPGQAMTWSLSDPRADLVAGPPARSADGIAFAVKRRGGEMVDVSLKVPGCTIWRTRSRRSVRLTHAA